MIQFTIKYNVSYENLHFCVCDFFVVRFIELLLERRKWNIIAQFCDGISHCHRRILYCSYKRDIVICVCSSVSLVNTTETMQSLVFEQSTADLIGVLLFLCIQIDIVCFFFFFFISIFIEYWMNYHPLSSVPSLHLCFSSSLHLLFSSASSRNHRSVAFYFPTLFIRSYSIIFA